MLIITRRPDESVKIGDDITVTVMDVRGNHIRIGIDAPDEVKIVRTELLEKTDED